MKRFLIVVVILSAATGAFAQTILNLNQFQSAFKDFADGVAPALPLDASVGLNWSDAYIGQFPHFGIGISVGAATFPYSAVSKAASDLGGNLSSSLPSGVSYIKSTGVPLPAYSFDLRIGGFGGLPFDIGLKFGYIPSINSVSSSSVNLSYTLVGGDFRYVLMKDGPGSPGLSVGIGYTYMSGTVALPGVIPTIQINNLVVPSGTDNIQFSSPTLWFSWDTSVIDLKAQLSKNLRIITPYIGAGVAYGISHAGGGVNSTMTINGSAPTQAQIHEINSTYGTDFTLQGLGFGVKDGVSGISTRVFGGLSINLWVLKIGLGGAYEFLSGSIAAMVNVRLQF